MVVTVPGDSGILVRSRVVVELVRDTAPAPAPLPSMVETTVLYWDLVLRMKVATTTTVQARGNNFVF